MDKDPIGSYLVVDRAVVCGGRAKAPLLRAGYRGTKGAVRADRLPELWLRQSNRSFSGRQVASRSRNRILSKRYIFK